MKKITTTALVLASIFVFAQQKNKSQAHSFSTKGKTVAVYTTAESTNLRLSKTDNLTFSELAQPTERQICVFVNPNKTFQSFLGIGGAITDASAEVFAKLSNEKQQELLNAYYNTEKGIGYTLIRTTIHSSDFSSGSYTYIDEGDTALKTFSIEHDRKYKIPLIKKAIAAAGGKITTLCNSLESSSFYEKQ